MVDWFTRPAAPKAGESFTKGANGGNRPPQEAKLGDNKPGNNYSGSGGWMVEYQKPAANTRQLK